METYEYKKYVCNAENLKETLDKYGVAVIPSVINDEECSNTIDGMWDYFEHITQKWETPITRDNTASWRQIFNMQQSQERMTL